MKFREAYAIKARTTAVNYKSKLACEYQQAEINGGFKMKNNIKKSICVFLTMVMMLSATVFCTGVSAATKVAASKIKKINYNQKKQTAKITWKKVKKATGYQLQVSTVKNFKEKTVYKIKKAKVVSKTIKKLTTFTTYYVRIRTYKTVKVKGKKKTVYSKFSPKKQFTTSVYYEPGQGLDGKTVGQSTLTSNITGLNYTLKFIDDFEGTQLNNKNWRISNGNANGSEVQVNVPENVGVENNNLILYARKTDQVRTTTQGRSTYYTGAKIDSSDLRSFRYGRVEMYARLPLGSNGTWPAFWTLGYGQWPMVGEIDILEMETLDYTYASTLHMCEEGISEPWLHDNPQGIGHASVDINDKFKNGYHLIGMEWTPSAIFMYCDNKMFGSADITKGDARTAFNNYDHFMILNFALGGMGGSILGPDGWFDTFEVDWVKIWQSDAIAGSTCYESFHKIY